MWPLDSEQPTHALGMAVVVRLLETVFDFPKLFRVTNHIHSWGGEILVHYSQPQAQILFGGI